MLRRNTVKIITLILCLFLVSSRVNSSDVKSLSSSFLIPLPNPCVYVKKIEKGKVYLDDLSQKEVCIQVISIKQAEVIPDDSGYVEIYYKGSLWKKIKVKGTLEDLVENISSAVFDKIYDEAGNFTEKSLFSKVSEKDREKLRESIRAVETYIQSPEFESKLEKEKKKVAELLNLEYFNETYKEDSFYEGLKEAKRSGLLKDDERLYVFVSSSLPYETVRNLVKSSSLLLSQNVVFVLRGGIKGLTYISPTVEWIYKVLVKEEGCNPLKEKCSLYPVKFQIDPFLFRRYGIEEVPAVVYVKGVKTEFGYSEGLPETKVEEFYISYGDVSLFYHLYVIGKASGNQEITEFAEKFLGR